MPQRWSNPPARLCLHQLVLQFYASTSPAPFRAPSQDGAVSEDRCSAGEIRTSQQRILDALAGLAGVGLMSPNRATVAAMSGYRQGGHFNNMLGGLRTRGLGEYPNPSEVGLTTDGRTLAREPVPIHSLQDLHEGWFRLLEGPQRRILSVLIECYPMAIARDELAHRASFAGGGHFNNTFGSLRTMGAAAYPGPGQVVATEVLFPDLFHATAS